MKILILNTVCPQGLANIEREFCASSTACALPSATTALSQAEALRSTTDERQTKRGCWCSAMLRMTRPSAC